MTECWKPGDVIQPRPHPPNPLNGTAEYLEVLNGDKQVVKPSHYTSHPSGVEAITIAEHYNFCIGNAIKYLWRAGLKGDSSLTAKQKEIQDLEKAMWYIQRQILNLKSEN